MLEVHVSIYVKPEFLEQFIAATITNATESLKESGITRFDLLRDRDDETHFVLVETYRDEQAPAIHKQTQHYATWRDTVYEMMALDRTSQKFERLYPKDGV